jgi:uncharacterized membrane-anchored protein
MLNKVPEVTLYFWVIKILCTTVGETAADFLNINLNFGLTGTSIVTGALLAIALFLQLRAKKYVPWIYWLTVALISIFGTLVTDNLTDAIGVPLEFTTVLFTALLVLTFLVWHLSERTLSVHAITTTRRETFYWLAILCAFALGTATGDLYAEGLGIGYLYTGIIVASLIILFAIGWKAGMHSVLSFWLIYILTRPLGASLGDLLTQAPNHGGLGLGTTTTSFIFLGAIFLVVFYLSLTKRDVISSSTERQIEEREKGGVWQTVIVVPLLVVVGFVGYNVRKAQLSAPELHTTTGNPTTGTGTTETTSPLGDLSTFKTISQDTLDLLNAGKQSEATARIGDLEYEWDQAEARLKPRDTAAWTAIDGKIDKVLRELRAVSPNMTTEKSALEALLAAFK